MLGTEVLTRQEDSSSFSINVSSLPEGVYYVNCVSVFGNVVQKLIIQ